MRRDRILYQVNEDELDVFLKFMQDRGFSSSVKKEEVGLDRRNYQKEKEEISPPKPMLKILAIFGRKAKGSVPTIDYTRTWFSPETEGDKMVGYIDHDPEPFSYSHILNIPVGGSLERVVEEYRKQATPSNSSHATS